MKFADSASAVEVLETRYLLRDEEGEIVETPDELLQRVSKAISAVEYKDVARWNEEFYTVMRDGDFLPNSPTLFNAGLPNGQLSACFVLPVHDSIEDIFETLKHASKIHQTGGGTGFDFSRLRPANSVVDSRQGVASGPISFATVYNQATEIMKQGGKRKGANMMNLRVDHPDILNFIDMKLRLNHTCATCGGQHAGAMTNFNVSVAITNEFMTALANDSYYELKHPAVGVTGKLRAADVWRRIAENAHASAEPGIVFIDRINERSPYWERIEATNPCVTADTWVHTSEGPRQVSDLVGKPFVARVNSKDWKSTNEGFFSSGIKPVVTVVTKQGYSLTLTRDHKLQLEDGELKPAGELVAGEKLSLNNHFSNSAWAGKYTAEQGYLAGLLVGDGTITSAGKMKNGKRELRAILSIWNPEDESSQAMMEAALLAYDSFRASKRFKGWSSGGRKEVRMFPAELTRFFINELELDSSKCITKAIEQASSDFYRGFLRGIFDADGSVQATQPKVSGGSIRLHQSDLPRLRAIQRMLLRLGIRSKIQTYKPEGFTNMPDGRGGFRLYKTKQQYDLIISKQSCVYFQRQIGFVHTEKQRKLDYWLDTCELRDEIWVTEVKEVVSHETPVEVFDVSIPGLNLFDANGFVARNCGEQPLPPYGACNLGSINLSNFVEGEEFDEVRFRSVVRTCVRFLDNVIDANHYPIDQITAQALKYRNIGLGPMGWADALIKMKIPYTAPKALEVGRWIQQVMNEEAHQCSYELGQEKGIPSGAPFLTFFDYSSSERRNATLTNAAPTGTLCVLVNCSSSIEANFGFELNQHVMDTVLTRYHPLYEAARNNGGVDKSIFIESHDVDTNSHVDMLAAFQENADAAISKTVNLPKDATVEDVENSYIRAWARGCKGITVYREGSREGTLHKRDEPKTTGENYCPECGAETIEQSGCTTCPSCHWSKCVIA